MASTVKSTYTADSSDDEKDKAAYIKDERWYDKSSAAYFTSNATRNSQTISLQQRHRPVFQLCVDLLTGIMLGSVLMISSVIQVRKMDHKGTEKWETNTFKDIIEGQFVRVFACAFFFLKFFAMAIWYRCKGYGNIMEHTKSLFIWRTILDLMVYAWLGYMIYVEKDLAHPNTVTDGTITISSGKSFLEKMLNDSNAQFDYHEMHFVLLGFLVLKEVMVYILCVKRAVEKLGKEKELNGTNEPGSVNVNEGFNRVK